MLVAAFSWGDFWRLALAVFLFAVGISFAYFTVRLAGTVTRLSAFIRGAEESLVPVILKVGGSVDRVNGQLDKVDRITDSAVDAADSVDTAVRAVSMAVTRPVQKVSEIAASRPTTTGARVADPVGARPRNLPTQPPPSVPLDERGTTPEGLTPGDVVLTHPRRTYGGNGRARRRRPPRLKLAVITGLVAFLIAAAAITLPELVFGGAVASHHSTTFFGGSAKSAKDKTNDNSNGSQDQNKNNGTTTTPQNQQSGKGTSTTPQSTPGQQSGQQPNGGSQPPPTQPAPAPSSPQSGGGSGQSTPTP